MVEDAQSPPGLRPSPRLATGVPRSLVCVRLRQGTRDAAHASGSWAASGSGRAPVSPLDTPSGPVTAPAPVRGARLDLSDASLKA